MPVRVHKHARGILADQLLGTVLGVEIVPSVKHELLLLRIQAFQLTKSRADPVDLHLLNYLLYDENHPQTNSHSFPNVSELRLEDGALAG